MKRKRKIPIGLAVLLALVVILPWTVHHHAKSTVENYRKHLIARGEKLTITENAPHYSADELSGGHDLMTALYSLGSRMTNAPLMMKELSPGHVLLNSAEEILPSTDNSNLWPDLQIEISKRAQRMDAVRAALQKPFGGVTLDYSQGQSLMLSHLIPTKNAAINFAAKAEFELHSGRLTNAMEDLQASIAITRVLEREPIMISQLVRFAILQSDAGVTWELLQSHDLQESQLAELQSTWSSIDLFKGMETSLAMERANLALTFEWARNAYSNLNEMGMVNSPSDFSQVLSDPEAASAAIKDYSRYWAWRWRNSYNEEFYNLRVMQTSLDTLRRIRTNEGFVPALREFDASLFKQKLRPSSSDISDDDVQPYQNQDDKGFLIHLEDGVVMSYLRKLGTVEVEQRLVITAIALKRFQLIHGKFPDELKNLVPEYLAAVPLDPMNGKPLHYHPKPDGTFLLYSVGPDGADNGGDPTALENPNNNNPSWLRARDIVWPVPATPEEVKTYKDKLLEQWSHKQEIQANASRRLPAAPMPPPK